MVWRKADPNEWLLLIKDGRMVKCGVGIRVWKSWGASVVKFPAAMQETSFRASQTTKQRAGVTVTGKAYWSIYRPVESDPNGPFRAYQMLQGIGDGDFGPASEKVQTLATSTVRAAVANMTIDEVMCNREQLKDQVKKSITDTFKGWGIWLETIEILDVIVESSQLFDDIQYLKPGELNFETKADANIMAERLRLATKTELARMRSAAAVIQAKEDADATTTKKIYQAEQSVKAETEQAKLSAQKQTILLADMANKRERELAAAADAAAVAAAKQERALQLEKEAADHKLALLASERDMQATYGPVHMQLAALKAAQEIYSSMPLKDVKLVSVGGAGAGTLEGLITPAVELLQNAVSGQSRVHPA